MKHAIIVHGFKGKPDTNCKPWLKCELEASGFRVDVPEMPDTNHPKVSSWVKKLEDTVGEIGSDEIYLIGHSLGCITILKYLAALHPEQRIKCCVFVAGSTRMFRGYSGGHDSFFTGELDYEAIRAHVDTMIAIQSEDDQSVGFEELGEFSGKLGAQTIAVSGFGHFSSADAVYEVPFIRDVVLDLRG